MFNFIVTVYQELDQVVVFSTKDVACGNWAVGKRMVGLWALCASEVAFDLAIRKGV
jgi:hypothetical protein